jgi:patatin-like phospholipase/acyl hydrolase
MKTENFILLMKMKTFFNNFKTFWYKSKLNLFQFKFLVQNLLKIIKRHLKNLIILDYLNRIVGNILMLQIFVDTSFIKIQ